MVPHTELQHLSQIPEDALSTLEFIKDELQPKYTLLHPCVNEHFYTICVPAIRALEKNFPSRISEMMEEVDNCVSNLFGEDTENWREVNIFETMQMVTSQVSNLFIVGKSLGTTD